jgi:hypothetical protein
VIVGQQLLFLLRVGEEASSTSAAGMLAPTSTRNGARWRARGLIGTRSRSVPSSACANAADCSM